MSGHKGNNDEARVPIGLVFISIGMIVLLTVAAIWLLIPNSMPPSVYNMLRPVLPETVALPTPASLAVVPTLTPQPETAVIVPETEQKVNVGIVSMEEALEQDPVTGSPVRIVIPAIELDAPVERIGVEPVMQGGETYYQWLVPEGYVAGWHENSARLGQPGNTVLNGHHNVHGEIFKDLVDVEEGDELIMYDEEEKFTYRVTTKEILPERDQPIEVRLENAQWIAPTEDERITLVTCWPYTDNSHRLVVVAKPIDSALSQ
jgi:LPXTG-site transpeptidase (sortase) family protein